MNTPTGDVSKTSNPSGNLILTNARRCTEWDDVTAAQKRLINATARQMRAMFPSMTRQASLDFAGEIVTELSDLDHRDDLLTVLGHEVVSSLERERDEAVRLLRRLYRASWATEDRVVHEVLAFLTALDQENET